MHIRFGDCTFDTDSRELQRGGRAVHVSGKAFRLLEMLVESAPRALSKNDLQDGVWPDVFVSESNLASLVAELRRALGDDARRPRSIRTVYGFGYAFCGELEATGRPGVPGRSGPSRFRLLWGQKEIVLAQGENIFGRGPESLEWINRETVSRRHARILVTGDAATLEDLGSKNGSFLRGRPVEGVEPLADGDEIRLGSVPFTVRVFADPGSTATRSRTRSGGEAKRDRR